MMFREIFARGAKTGAVLATATTAFLLTAGYREMDAPWAPINDICHVVDGDAVGQPHGWSRRESLLGLGINMTAMCAWGITYDGALAVAGRRSTPAFGIAGAAAAYLVDYHLVPKRLAPGIERRLSRQSVLGAYAVIAAVLGCSAMWNRTRSR